MESRKKWAAEILSKNYHEFISSEAFSDLFLRAVNNSPFISLTISPHLVEALNSWRSNNSYVISSKISQLNNAKSKDELAVALHGITELNHLTTAITAFRKTIAESAPSETVWPFANQTLCEGEKLALSLFSDPKITQKNTDEMALLAETLEQSRRVLANPQDDEALHALILANSRLDLKTKSDEKWLKWLPFKASVARLTGMALLAIGYSFAATVIGAGIAIPFMILGTYLYDEGKEMKRSFKKGRNQKKMIENVSKRVEALVTKTISTLDEWKQEKAAAQKDLEGKMTALKTALDLPQNTATTASEKPITSHAKLFQNQDVPFAPGRVKEIHPFVNAVYEAAASLKLTDTANIKLLATIVKNAKSLLKHPAEWSKHTEPLETEMNILKDKIDTNDDEKWQRLNTALEELITKIKQPELSKKFHLD